MRNKIIEILKEHEGWVDRSRTDTCVWPDDYGDVADEIVKLFSMSDVGQRFSQLPEDYKRYAELSFKYRQEGCTEDEDEEHWNLKVKLGVL